MKYDSKNDTLAHIEKIQEFIGRFSSTLTQREGYSSTHY